MTVAAPARTGTAAVLDAPRRFELTRVPFPDPAPGQVLVRLEGCGICASSVPVWEGRPWFSYPLPPGAPGHEAWGTELESGRRVALLHEQALAEVVAVDRASAVTLPPELDGLPFPGEPLGCAMNVLARSEIGAGDTVAIVGAGFLGLLLVQLCVGAGARTVVFSRRGTGLELARSFGAETPEAPEDESCDVAIETGGRQETLDVASRLPRVRGRLVLAGYHQDGSRRVDVQSWNWRGLDVVNAHERDPALYREGIQGAVRAVAGGRLDPAPLYTHVLPLARLDEAFRLASERPDGFVKALVTLR